MLLHGPSSGFSIGGARSCWEQLVPWGLFAVHLGLCVMCVAAFQFYGWALSS